MNPMIENIDNELIFDIGHIIMNYIKLNNFNSDCLKGTNIQISPNILSNINNTEYTSNSNKFASNYFLQLTKTDNVIDLLSPIISNYPNSELGLFLTVLLKKHIIDISQNLNTSTELFQKYKNEILSMYQKVLPQQKKSKLLENICASITVLIIIGFQGQWTIGIDQLLVAAKENNGETGNNLIAALILANVDNIYLTLEQKIDSKSANFILSLFDNYSYVVNDYINFLIKNSFSGEKSNFVNGELFKAFIGILQSAKYFKINFIKNHGFLEFLINCISYIDINQDFIAQICEVFDNIFSSPDKELKYNYENNFKISDFTNFVNEIPKNEDFQEVIKCIKLIYNVKNFYSNKNINEINNNQKDIQILFASCNIFNSICENYGYIFIIPELDDIIQEIYNYFINVPVFKINQILLSSFIDFYSLSQTNYKFDNYDNTIRENKKKKLNDFLYGIQNSVMEKMKLTNDEITTFNIEQKNNNKNLSSIHLDKYINELLKININDDEKINFMENCDDFYNDIYDIIINFFDSKDYCNKLCQFLANVVKTNDFASIYSLMNVFIILSFKIGTEHPSIIINLIEFILSQKDVLFKNKRFILQFCKLLYKVYIQISKNEKCLNLVISNLITDNNIKALNDETINNIIIILINKLILTSYQCFKMKEDDDISPTTNTIDKEALNNIFNTLSAFLLDNLNKLNHFYLYKIIDAFYNSLFYNVALNINNSESIYTASEKLIKEANQIYNSASNGNDNDNINKYIFILWSVIKNVGKEKKDVLLDLLNKVDPSYTPSQSYLLNLQKNILKIINNNINGNRNIIDSVNLLNNSLILILKEKAVDYYDDFNQIISLILPINQKYVKIFSLTLNLYTQIFNFNQNTEKYNVISKIGFDVMNSINIMYNNIKNEDELIYLANKQVEFLLLYIQKCPYFLNNLNQEIFIQTINNIINIFDKTNQKELTINFMNCMKVLFELANKNDSFMNLIKDNFVEKIIKTVINHIQYFDPSYIKCVQNCFEIFKNCVGTPFEEKFCTTLYNIYNDQELVGIIAKYIGFLKNSNNLKNYTITKKIKEFITDLSELYYAMNKKRNEFVKKYEDEMNNGIVDEEKMKAIRINPNSQIYMDLYVK